EQKKGQHVPVAHAQQSRKLEEQRDRQEQREIEPGRGVGQVKIEKNRMRGHGPSGARCKSRFAGTASDYTRAGTAVIQKSQVAFAYLAAALCVPAPALRVGRLRNTIDCLALAPSTGSAPTTRS